jgi:hypothetical protein
LNNESIRLRIKGDDAWLPASFFIFGLDKELPSSFSQSVTPLVHLEDWPFGWMSTDMQEGAKEVTLPLLP